MSKLNGVDVSRWNVLKDANWNRIEKDNVSFVYVKCTEGAGYFSDVFQEQYTQASLRGAMVGGYHFYKPYIEPLKQASLFIEKLKLCWKKGDLPPMIDVEDPIYSRISPKKHLSDLTIMVKRVENEFGVKPVIYTGYYYWVSALGNLPGLEQYPLWVASYTKKIPAAFGGWVNSTKTLNAKFWQWGGEKDGYGRVTNCLGITPIDRNTFYGTAKDLFQLCGIESIKPPTGFWIKSRAIQLRLNDLAKLNPSKFPELQSDGKWGNNTRDRLSEWQKENDLDQVNELTPDSWMALFGFKYV